MIRIGYYTPEVIFSSELPDITIFTDGDWVNLRLSLGGFVLLDERYYAINGRVVVTDIASLVEERLAGTDDCGISPLTIEAEDVDGNEASQEVNVIYCHADIGLFDPMDFLRENFLTLSAYRRIAPNGFFEVQWYAADREGISFRVYCTYLDPNGNPSTYSYVKSGNGLIQHGAGINREIIFYDQVVEKIKSVKKIDSLTLQSITVRCGERSMTVFVDPSLAGVMPLFYTNCFNVVESLYLQRVTTEKVKRDQSIAVLGKSSQFYDVSTSKEYDVQSGSLTSDECAQVEQMLTSPSVRLPWGTNVVPNESDFYAMIPILITDFTSELSDSDEKPNSVKFTWRFMENRPKANFKFSPGIFDSHFNPTFS